MLKRLLWKEWWENLWKLGFCAGVSLAFTILLFRLRIFPDLENAYFISLVQMIVVPVVYALDLFAGEMSNRTIHLLFKIPVPRWKIFFAKYLTAVAGIVLSFVVGLPFGVRYVALCYSVAIALIVVPATLYAIKGTTIRFSDILKVIGQPLASLLVAL
ncbi:MAG: ABC transporter permease subunit, partial [Planctomycetes bacterium]|nr:ABC transporter permease subunit [Planctomycetota bacterium]